MINSLVMIAIIMKWSSQQNLSCGTASRQRQQRYAQSSQQNPSCRTASRQKQQRYAQSRQQSPSCRTAGGQRQQQCAQSSQQNPSCRTAGRQTQQRTEQSAEPILQDCRQTEATTTQSSQQNPCPSPPIPSTDLLLNCCGFGLQLGKQP